MIETNNDRIAELKQPGDPEAEAAPMEEEAAPAEEQPAETDHPDF